MITTGDVPMLKIDTKKIWELLKKDKKVQKELLKYVKEEQEKLEEAKAIYQSQLEVIEELKTKRDYLRVKRQKIEDEIVEKNGDISIIEIKKIFLNRRLKRAKYLATSAKSKRKQKKYLNRAKELEKEMQEYSLKQDNLLQEIENLQIEKENTIEETSNVSREINHEQDVLEEDFRVVSIWQEAYDTKLNRFYAERYDEVTGYFKPCHDLVVPDLEENKQMTKEDAKQKANPIIIDEDRILSKDQIRVRRLTKDEKEEYRKVS